MFVESSGQPTGVSSRRVTILNCRGVYARKERRVNESSIRSGPGQVATSRPLGQSANIRPTTALRVRRGLAKKGIPKALSCRGGILREAGEYDQADDASPPILRATPDRLFACCTSEGYRVRCEIRRPTAKASRALRCHGRIVCGRNSGCAAGPHPHR